jgi:hypothetical protein
MTPATKKWKNTYVQNPHNPNLPIMVQTQRFWYPVRIVSQEVFLSKMRVKNIPIAVGEGHIAKHGSQMLCGQEATALHEAEDKRINESKPDEQKIKIYSHYSDKPIGRLMCKHCLAIYKKMPDWTRWADAVDSYPTKTAENKDAKEVKSKNKRTTSAKASKTKPKAKSTAKPRRSDHPRDATKTKKRT